MSLQQLPISIEFFPPKTPEGVAKLRSVRQQLYALRPEFCSVLSGAVRPWTAGRSQASSRLLPRWPKIIPRYERST